MCCTTPNTATTRIIDFGLSEIQLAVEDKAGSTHNNMGGAGNFQGTLAFVSPEQTGRVNRGVDYRSDLYSLGAVMYQMLTGKLPFVSEERDELELVHAIITKTPVAPLVHRPTLPPMLSAVIMKLLSKNADDRYQSTRGAEQDLQTVWHQLTTNRPGYVQVTPPLSRQSTPVLPSTSTTPPPTTSTPQSPLMLTSEVAVLSEAAALQQHSSGWKESGEGDAWKAETAMNGHLRPAPVSAQSNAAAISPSVSSPYLSVRTLASHNAASHTPPLPSSTTSSTSSPLTPIRPIPHHPSPLPPTDDELNLASIAFPSFPLGRGDIPSRLHIPNKLYGREEELVKMRRAFDTVVDTSESVVFCVDGVAGAGKSSSIRQVCHSISAAYPHCLVVSSKLDQYNRQPFGLFKQLVSEMVLDILTQPTRSLARWRASVLSAVGSSGRLMIEIFPSLQQLIGEQPPVPVLPPAEAQQRFLLVFTAFLCCFCPPHRPLVMFFDDVQWADDNSLQGLEHFAVNPDCKHVLLVVAYRKEEMHAQHSLLTTLDRIRQAGKQVQSITCNPLSLPDLQQMVADTMHCPVQQALMVATLLFQRAEGNPFFARQLLLQMHRDRLITYHAGTTYKSPSTEKRGVEGLKVEAAMEVRGEWRFDYAAFLASNQQLTSNVLDLVRQLINRLSPTAQRLLSLAACIGTQFDADTLAVVSEMR